jgi:very-short-patch-repair endonuclease
MDRYGKALCMGHQKTDSPKSQAPASFNKPQFHEPQANACSVCKQSISGQVYDYSINHFGAALCMTHQKTVTSHALKLSNALKSLDVEHEMEYSDGHKHVDIAIPAARMYLELDGAQHAFSPKQMCADDERDKHSHKDGYITKRIPNLWVEQNADKLAASIAILAKKREYELREAEKERAQKITLTGIMKTVVNTARKISEQLDDFE